MGTPPLDRQSVFRHKRIWMFFILLAIGGFFVNNRLLRQDPVMDEHAKMLRQEARKLAEFAIPLGPPQPGDWLSEHTEWGQTFRQYLACDPVVMTPERCRIYVLPLGEFSEEQKSIVDLSAEFLSLYFCCDVVTLDPVGAHIIPPSARRLHPQTRARQFKTSYILKDVLRPRLPDDAAA